MQILPVFGTEFADRAIQSDTLGGSLSAQIKECQIHLEVEDVSTQQKTGRVNPD